MDPREPLVFDTHRNAGALATVIAARPITPATMSGADAAKALMLARFPLEPSRVVPQPSAKLNAAARRRAKLAADPALLAKLNGA